LYTYVTSWAN